MRRKKEARLGGCHRLRIGLRRAVRLLAVVFYTVCIREEGREA